MPTGYTAKVQTGEVVTLKEYALQCARAFGACVEFRDEPMDKPIPETFKIDQWYLNSLEDAENDLTIALSYTLKDAEALCEREYDEELAQHKARQSTKEKERKNYQNMLDKTRDWRISPELEGLKVFMISQLENSIQWDCSTYEGDEPVKKDAYEWLKEKKSIAEDRLQSAKDSVIAEQRKLDSSNKWLKSLRDSLKSA